MAAELQPLIDKVWRHCEENLPYDCGHAVTRARSAFCQPSRSGRSVVCLECDTPWREPMELREWRTDGAKAPLAVAAAAARGCEVIGCDQGMFRVRKSGHISI
jgi:hypothetical protein